MKKRVVSLALLAALALPLTALAESHEEAAPPQPVIWVSFLKAAASGQELVENIIKEDAGLWGELLAEGKILEWGVAQPVVHSGEDRYDVAEWATFADWGAMDAFVAGFMAKQAAKSPEEMKASQEAYMSVVVPGSHYDHVHQSIYAATNGQRPGYLSLGFQKAHPGKDGALVEIWMEHAKPMFEQLMSDGAIQGFGLFTQAMHGDHTWTHGSWMTMPGLAGMDAVNKAFAGLQHNEEAMTGFMSAVDWEAHWDELLAVVHYENAQSE